MDSFVADGGLQYISLNSIQYVYLDFDGESTRYNGEILTVEDVAVKDSSLTDERIAGILTELNAKYADQNVIFVTRKPQSGDYSTIFIGKTAAFDQYGHFAGVAETIDKGNQLKSDNAFVILDAAASNEQIISTVSHETDHLLGTLDHGGDGLAAYAEKNVVGDGVSSAGVIISSGDRITVSNGGVVNSATVNSGGSMRISSGGAADSAMVNAGGHLDIYSGGTATNVVWTPGVGEVVIRDGAYVTYTSQYSGVYFGSNNQLLSHAQTMENTVIAGLRASMYVMGGTVNGTTISGGDLYISSAGVANLTEVNTRGCIYISNGGVANTITFNGSVGGVFICSGGIANSAMFNSSGQMLISSGGIANFTKVESASQLRVLVGGTANSTTVNFDGGLLVSGGAANNTVVNTGGDLIIFSDGVANSTTLNSTGGMFVYSGGVANSTTVYSGGCLFVYSGGCARAATVYSGGGMLIMSGGIYRGALLLQNGAIVNAEAGTIIDFTVADRTANDGYLINNLARILGTPIYTITVSAEQANGVYKLAQGASDFTGTVFIGNSKFSYEEITVNGDDFVRDNVTYSLDQIDGNLTLTVTGQKPAPVLTGSVSGLRWANIPGSSFAVEYSKDDFASILKVETTTNALDTFGMASGTYQWQVCGTDQCCQGENIISTNSAEPQVLRSNADGNKDLFFANASGVWKAGYAAQHLGTLGGWNGTGELVGISGKNKLADVFTGSTDANVLVLTDDANGDALFLDDIYTSFGKDAARIAQINEIRAGAGDDIVDLTSQRYTLAGAGVKVYGGDGNDTIWANLGDNILFGDAGNDRLIGASGSDILIGGAGNDSMNGGGGNDTFCFGSDWGNDTVEQLAGGTVTLWFESNSGSWDESSLTYTDGANSVQVSGVTEVTLKFGDVDTAPAGAFLDAASQKIFENESKGMIA